MTTVDQFPVAQEATPNHLLIDSMFSEELPQGKPGDYQYEPGVVGKQSYFWLSCPKCGQLSALAIRPVIDPVANQQSWELSGEDSKPTLQPSINHIGCWHGWLTNGKFIQA